MTHGPHVRFCNQFQGGMTTLNSNFNKEYAAALQDLADTEERVSKNLEGKMFLFLHNG